MGSDNGAEATSTEEMRRMAGRAAVEFVRPDEILGVGTGSTVAHFIEALARTDSKPKAAVATSADTARRLGAASIETVSLSCVDELGLYVDGADQIDTSGRLIKGRGGAHTLEKIVASASEVFVCVADQFKLAPRLGKTVPLPIEVLEVAERQVRLRVGEMGGEVHRRQAPVTQRGTVLLDVEGLGFENPEELERILDAIPGVLECGLFAIRKADVALVGMADGSVRRIELSSMLDDGEG